MAKFTEPLTLDVVRARIFYLAAEVESVSPPAAMLLRAVVDAIESEDDVILTTKSDELIESQTLSRLLSMAERSKAVDELLQVAETIQYATPGPAWLPRGLPFLESGNVAVDRVAERLGISRKQLATTAGVSPESIGEASQPAVPMAEERLRDMLEIVARVSTWAGGERQALAWYRAQPLSAFGGRTPEALVKSGEAATVRDYLDHIAIGGYA